MSRYTELVFFEVARDRRSTGVGREAVRLLALLSSRPLLALSEDADRFWRAFGWAEHITQLSRSPNGFRMAVWGG